MIDTLSQMDTWLVLTFVSAGIALNLTPGADVAFAVGSGLSGGWRSGVAAAGGISLGGLVHVTLAAVGLSALLMASTWAYDATRYAGAAYLAYLAVRAWRSADTTLEVGTGARTIGHAFQRGFITSVLNPKVALFIPAFLPQFTRADVGPIWHQILILGTMFAFTGFFVTAGYGVAAGLLRSALYRISGTLNKLTAVVFGGLAARLLLD